MCPTPRTIFDLEGASSKVMNPTELERNIRIVTHSQDGARGGLASADAGHATPRGALAKVPKHENQWTSLDVPPSRDRLYTNWTLPAVQLRLGGARAVGYD